MAGGASDRVTAREIEQRGGLPVAQTVEMVQALGFPALSPDQPWFEREEADALVALAGLEHLWPPDAHGPGREQLVLTCQPQQAGSQGARRAR